MTGATGFIGQELAKKLESNELHCIERYVTGRYGFDAKNAIIHHVNLTDYNRVRAIVKEIQPDIVMHLAAISAVSYSYDNPIEVSEVNYIGSINLAEACRTEAHNLTQFIAAGTSEEYGMSLTSAKEKLSEDSPLMPNSPYACAKVAFDNYLRYMGLAYSFPYTIMRPFNTYGRKNNRHFFIERTISEMLSNPRGTIYLGDPDAVRDWLYVDDHVQAYLSTLGNKAALGQAFNFGTGKGYTTRDTAELIAELAHFSGHIVWNSTPRRPLDARVLIGDSSKAGKLLNWKPKYTLTQGLQKTVAHWRSLL